MDKFFWFFFPIVFLCLLFNSQFAFSAKNETPIVVNPLINIDISGVINAITGATNQVKDFTGKLPQQGFDLFKNYFENSLNEFSSPLTQLFYLLLVSPPDIEPMRNAWNSVISLISLFYLLNLSVAGLFFIIAFENHAKRAEAKELIKGVIISIIIISASFELYKILLEIGTLAAAYVLGNHPEKFILPAIQNNNPLLIIFLIFAAGFAGFTLFLRQIILLVGTAILPIGIFSYFTPPLKQFGKAIFGILGVAILLQFFDSIILVAATGAVLGFGNAPASQYLPAFAFFTIGAFNIAAMAFAFFRPVIQIASSFIIAPIFNGGIAKQFSGQNIQKKQVF
jgi:hypothetical protein